MEGADLCDFFPSLTICTETGNQLEHAWSLLEVQNCSSGTQIICFYTTWRFSVVFIITHCWNPCRISQIHSTHSTLFLSYHFNAKIPSRPSTLSVSKRYPNKNSVSIPCSPNPTVFPLLFTVLTMLHHPSQQRSFASCNAHNFPT